MSSFKGKPKRKASEQAANGKRTSVRAKVKSRLLRCATRSLKQRYQRIVDDMDYWEIVHASFLLEKYLKQFNSVRKRFDKSIEFDPTDEDQESKAKESVRYAVALIGNFEKKIGTELERGELLKSLDYYRKRAGLLSGSSHVSSDEVGPQINWWTYFRVAMEQRMVPQYNGFLDKVDIIARDCYYPLLKALENFLNERLETQQGWLAPLTMLQFGGVYRTLSTQFAPVPYILVPFDRMDNVWNLCAIHHEVAHDFYHKLNSLKERDREPVATHYPCTVQALLDHGPDRKPDPELETKLTADEQNVSRFLGLGSYLNWLEEIFADFIGIMLSGPTYINSLMEILVDNDVDIRKQTYPSPYMRVVLNVIFAGKQLGYMSETEDLLAEWLMIFSDLDVSSDVGALSGKTKRDLMMLWLGQKTTKVPERKAAFQILYQACDELTRRLNIQGQPKSHMPGPESSQEAKQLKTSDVMSWLLKFVNACWQAELVPSTGLSLLEIDEHMANMGQKSDQQHINATAAYIMQVVKTDMGEAAELDQPIQCRARHLVPATRLVFEALLEDSTPNMEWSDEADLGSIGTEKNLRHYFLDFLNDAPEVAIAFKKLQDTASQELELDYDYWPDYHSTMEALTQPHQYYTG